MINRTIIERIKNARKFLGVSPQELVEQMIDFYKAGDSAGIQEMFEEYKNWEIRSRNVKKSVSNVIKSKIVKNTKESMDYLARIADGYFDNGVIEIINAKPLPESTSESISQFYRGAIGYQPFDSSMN